MSLAQDIPEADKAGNLQGLEGPRDCQTTRPCIHLTSTPLKQGCNLLFRLVKFLTIQKIGKEVGLWLSLLG